MTSFRSTEVKCSNCENEFEISFEASINTWIDPTLIGKILREEYIYQCDNCKTKVHLKADILINCPNGMFYINTASSLEENIKKLLDYEVITSDGEILKPNREDNPPQGNHEPSIAPTIQMIEKVIEKFKNDILEKSD